MKRSCLPKKALSATKKGVASLYVVLFATLLFGVVTIGFTRIIVSETTQTSNDDLSRSAYDSALAGVEDAKRTVNAYYKCLSTKDSYTCNNDYGSIFSNNCNRFNGDTEGKEVAIQTSSDGTGEFVDQAYTCVILSDVTPDYRGTLTADTRVKMIPLNVKNPASGGSTSQINKVTKVNFSWYSDLNQGNNSAYKGTGSSSFGADGTNPPTIQLSFIKVPSGANLDSLRTENNTGEVIYSTMVFLPTKFEASASGILQISSGTLLSAGNATERNEPFTIECAKGKEFACTAQLNVSGLKVTDNVFLVASLPYGDAFTDFAVTLLDDVNNPINFVGAQISVDSTGRANQLYRRVETRLDPADLFFPYPQYALELDNGESNKALIKNFWITANCWNAKDGSIGSCDNNGEM